MVPKSPDWYRHWSLEIKDQSWVENTENQVEFVIKALNLKGNERILDLACGFGRHSLAFARRGFPVVGVDITAAYVEDASENARRDSLGAEFLCSDIREIKFQNEFDVVLNLADGAIGYLENDEENLKIFDIISGALKPGGKHFMDVCNARHAEHFFPKRNWDVGSREVSLSEFGWDERSRRMLFGEWEIPFGQAVQRPEPLAADSIRLYSHEELEAILQARHMEILRTFSNYYGKEETDRELQLIVCSQKTM